jgi:hypothetical protein
LLLGLFRQFPKQFISGHHRLPRIHDRRESQRSWHRLHLFPEPPKIHTLSG